MRIVNAFAADVVGVLSCTVAENEKRPAWLGVPVIAPDVARLNPVGSVPDATR